MSVRSVACHVCSSTNVDKLYQLDVRNDQRGRYEQDSWPVVRCNECGLIYSNPQPSKDSLNKFYTFENEVDQAFVENWFIANADLQREVWQRYLRVIQQYSPGSRLLDVGCGAGSFLVEARAAKYEVEGQEIAPFFVDYCQQQQHLKIHEGELEELPVTDASFDSITAFDVIEHHHDPRQLVNTMAQLLKPNGLLVIGTHDIGNVYAKAYGKRWRYLQPIGHLTYFSRKTLQQMLEQAGFRVVRVGGIHTIDRKYSTEIQRYISQFVRVIVARAFILGIYKPITQRVPSLTKWRIQLKRGILTHEKLIRRAGSQIIMNDNLLMLAIKDG